MLGEDFSQNFNGGQFNIIKAIKNNKITMITSETLVYKIFNKSS